MGDITQLSVGAAGTAPAFAETSRSRTNGKKCVATAISDYLIDFIERQLKVKKYT